MSTINTENFQENNLLLRFLDSYEHPAIALWRAIESKHIYRALSNIELKHPVLDLGCGEGKVSSELFNQIDVGLDMGADEINKAKSTGTYDNLIAGDGRNLPFADETFGLVFSNCVIEHINPLDSLLKEISQVLKKDAYFVFTVPSENFEKYLFFSVLFNRIGFKKAAHWYESKRNQYLNHYNIFNENTWNKKLEDEKLKVIKTEQYISKSALEIWDLLASLGFLYRKFRLNKISVPIKLSIHLRKLKIKVLMRLLMRCYKEESEKGGGLLIVTKKV